MTDTTEPTAPDVANPSYWAKTLVTVRDKLDDALAAESADTIFESIYGKLKRKREEIALGMLGVVKRDYDGKVRWEIDPFTRERTPASLANVVTAKAPLANAEKSLPQTRCASRYAATKPRPSSSSSSRRSWIHQEVDPGK